MSFKIRRRINGEKIDQWFTGHCINQKPLFTSNRLEVKKFATQKKAMELVIMICHYFGSAQMCYVEESPW